MRAPFIHRDFAQHDPEWRAIKAGKWSASNAAVIMGGLDTGGLSSLIQDIAWERVFGSTDNGFRSEAMDRGIQWEAEARRWYCQMQGTVVEEVGFVTHATLPTVGWSPDGLRGSKRAIEIKCPLHKAWMACKKAMKVPAEYRWQCRWAMWVGQLDSLDFVMYHPQPGGLVIPCEVTPEEIEQMTERVALLEGKVAGWIEVIGNSRNTFRPESSQAETLDLEGVSF